MSFKIVDVSNNNGHVDFHAVKHAGAVGVWLKVTEGVGFVDETYAANRAAAKAAGLKVGGYHFGHPKDGSTAEASFFLQHLKLEPGDLIPVLDLEEAEGDAATIHAYASGFLSAVSHKIGDRAGLYCGSYFMRSYGLDGLPGPKWVPSYGAQPAFYKWDAWQFSDGEPKYPGSIEGLDTSIAPSLAPLVYRASGAKRIGAKVKRKLPRKHRWHRKAYGPGHLIGSFDGFIGRLEFLEAEAKKRHEHKHAAGGGGAAEKVS